MNQRINFAEIEKINIYIDEDTYNKLMHDMENLNICRKSNGETNKNDFIAKIIVNFGDEYRNLYNASYTKIKKVLEKNWVTKETEYSIVSTEILKALQKDRKEREEDNSRVLPFRPQTKNDQLMAELNEISIFLSKHEMSVSDYFRSMIKEFSKLSFEQKEKVMFLTVYSTIEQAIKNKKNINITVSIRRKNKTAEQQFICSPYAIIPSSDTGYNYLLAASDDRIIVNKIQDIKYVSYDHSTYDLSEEITEELKNSKRNPEFAFEAPVKIYVLLTKWGIKMLHQIKTLRPSGKKIDDAEMPKELKTKIDSIRNDLDQETELYCFNSSEKQAEFYFERFGSNAIVVYPESLRNKIAYFYKSGSLAYKQ